MLMSGQSTMKPVPWNVLLVVPCGVMLWAWVPTKASAVGHILEDVDRRLLIQDGGVEALALDVVLASLAVDERDQALATAPWVDERAGDVDVVGATVGERDVAESRCVSHVFDRGRPKSGRVG